VTFLPYVNEKCGLGAIEKKWVSLFDEFAKVIIKGNTLYATVPPFSSSSSTKTRARPSDRAVAVFNLAIVIIR
jgi:hypothetical protein